MRKLQRNQQKRPHCRQLLLRWPISVVLSTFGFDGPQVLYGRQLLASKVVRCRQLLASMAQKCCLSSPCWFDGPKVVCCRQLMASMAQSDVMSSTFGVGAAASDNQTTSSSIDDLRLARRCDVCCHTICNRLNHASGVHRCKRRQCHAKGTSLNPCMPVVSWALRVTERVQEMLGVRHDLGALPVRSCCPEKITIHIQLYFYFYRRRIEN